MKKILVLVMVLYAMPSFTQTEKGRFTFGLSQATFSATKNKNKMFDSESDQTSFSLSPSAGYFVVDDLIIGISLKSTFLRSKQKNSFSTSKYKTSDYSIGPWVEYFIGNGLKGRPFINIYPTIGFGNSEAILQGYPEPVKSDFTMFDLSGSIGYALFLNDSFMLRFSGGYSFSNFSTKVDGMEQSDQNTGKLFFGIGILTTYKKR